MCCRTTEVILQSDDYKSSHHVYMRYFAGDATYKHIRAKSIFRFALLLCNQLVDDGTERVKVKRSKTKGLLHSEYVYSFALYRMGC